MAATSFPNSSTGSADRGVATARLAALRPLQWPGQSPPPRREGNPELLRLCLPVLEKAHLMHTDVRAEGFRWYVTIPWHALAIAMAERYVSSDSALVQHAWPLVETSYLQHETTLGGRQSSGCPLGQLMRRTREKLAVTMTVTASRPVDSLTSCSWSPATPPVFPGRDRPQGGSDSTWPLAEPTTPADLWSSSSLLPLSTWESISPPLENMSLSAAVPPTTPVVADGLDPGTEMMWEELFSGAAPFNEIAGADVFFFEPSWA